MKARLFVFPVKGRNWCFAKAMDRTVSESESTRNSQTFKDLWKKMTSNVKSISENAELVTDFASEKMNRAWISFGKAPVGTVKHKIYGLGQRLLKRVHPSEFFLKSISKEITNVEITYPVSLNPRLVRRRLRHIALRGSIFHRRYFYGSVSLLPLTSVFTVLPLPNIPFFWVLFRAYSHWKALKGSHRLLLLVSDCSKSWSSIIVGGTGQGTNQHDSGHVHKLSSCPWVLQPSGELEKLLCTCDTKESVSDAAVSAICKTYHLDCAAVRKYRNSVFYSIRDLYRRTIQGTLFPCDGLHCLPENGYHWEGFWYQF